MAILPRFAGLKREARAENRAFPAQSVTDVSPSCTVMTVPASTSVPASMFWLSTRMELDSLPVVPENRISSPALTATVLASDGVRPSSVGTTHFSVGFFSLA